MKPHHIALAVFAMALWGFNFVTISLGLKEIPPMLFTAIRFTLTVFPFIFFVRKPDVSWPYILGVGFFMLTLQFGFLYKGMQMGVGGGIASTVAQVQVFFTIIFGALLLRERPSHFDIGGLGLAVIGITLIGLTMGRASLSGLFMVVGAGFFWSLGTIILKKSNASNMLAMIIYASLVPPIPMFALSYFLEGPVAMQAAIASISWTTIVSLAFIVLASTLFCYTVWGYLMRKYESRQVVPFALLVPIFGILSGWIFLNESFGPQRLLGAGLVVLGLVVVNWRSFFRR